MMTQIKWRELPSFHQDEQRWILLALTLVAVVLIATSGAWVVRVGWGTFHLQSKPARWLIVSLALLLAGQALEFTLDLLGYILVPGTDALYRFLLTILKLIWPSAPTVVVLALACLRDVRRAMRQL